MRSRGDDKYLTGNVPDILIVEDDKTTVEFMLEALNEHNLAKTVKVLKDGAEALDCLFASGGCSGFDSCKRPRLIVLDLKLPKVGGLEVLRRIRSDTMTKIIPVVIFTSSDQEQDRTESYRLGANSYIVKPVDYDSFIKTVSKIGFYWLTLNEHPAEEDWMPDISPNE